MLANRPGGHLIILLATAALWSGQAAAQDMSDVEIRTVPVSGSVYMLVGQGGNIGISVGEDGVFMIDDQFAPLTDKILAAVRELTPHDVRFLVNTHWHGDHTGGNENLGKGGSVIVAHANVRERMSTEQFMEAFDRRTPASPADALPVITFDDGIEFHWNGDKIFIRHAENAHTDGDALIYFSEANAFHMGDTYFNGRYPFIDYSSGGSIYGVIEAADRVLRIANSDSRIIPGHGELSNIEELRAYRDMLVTVRDRMQAMINDGATAGEIIASKPTADFDAEWGGREPDDWVALVYAGMVED